MNMSSVFLTEQTPMFDSNSTVVRVVLVFKESTALLWCCVGGFGDPKKNSKSYSVDTFSLSLHLDR
jgi:hypothetical protein